VTPDETHPSLRRVLELVQLLQLHREVASRYLAGDTSVAASRARLAMWIAEHVARRLPPQQCGLMSHAWQLLSRLVRQRRVTAEESEALHATLIRRYLIAAERLSAVPEEAPAAPGVFVEAVDGLSQSLSAGKLAIRAQLTACFRALDQRHAAA
jgi:hypothetical protein